MIGAAGADEFQDFLGDAMHVDGERDAAETYQRKAQFFFLQAGLPGSWRCCAAATPSLPVQAPLLKQQMGLSGR